MPFVDLNYTSQHKFKCMNDREYQFLKECCSIMKPFKVALDILRGEDTCYHWHASTNARSSDGLNPGSEAWPNANDHWTA